MLDRSPGLRFLVARVLRGDQEAFHELLEGHRRVIASTLAAHGVRSRDAAFDLAQEVALRVWLRLKELRDPDSFGGWLRRLTANAARDHLRRRAARPEDDLAGAGELAAADDPHATAERRVEARLMATALRAEPAEVVELLAARAEGAPVEELAERAGVSAAALKMRLSRARLRLRRRLAELRLDHSE
jgi:RNA polymerase sigma-70 factor (ECF subfamily)